MLGPNYLYTSLPHGEAVCRWWCLRPRDSAGKVATIHAWEFKKVLYMGFASVIPKKPKTSIEEMR